MNMKQAKVLLCDDNRDDAKQTAELLRPHVHSIDVVRTLEQFHRVTRHKEFDLILLDIQLPVLDGYGMLETLWSKHPEYADVPFVLLTALVDRQRAINGVELQADNYLTKPIDIDMLLERVEMKISNAG